MTISPKIRSRFGEPIGVELFFSFPEIYDNEKTFLDADAAAGASSITANGVNFSTSQYIVIGQPGSEKTEIIQVSTVTSPTSTTITLQTTLVFAHNRGDIIRFIPYNQITPERSTDSGSSFSALSAINIRPDAGETYLQRGSDASTDVYRFRFFNSSAVTYSGYSDNTVATGFADNTIFSVKKRALEGMGQAKSNIITDQMLNNAILEAQRELDQDPRILRWSFRTKFNTKLGQIVSGTWSMNAPSDLRDKNTYKNILSMRIGKQNRPLIYQDDNRFRQNYLNVAHTTLNGAVAAGATSITLTNSGDFDSSGSIVIASNTAALTTTTVSYTGNNKITNVLSGVTGVAAGGHLTGLNVWQNATLGLPSAYTIDNGVIYFDILFSDTYKGQNVWIDYYSTIPAISSDSQTFDEPDYDMFVSWLRWKIKYVKANGRIDQKSDSDYLEWVTRKEALITREITGQFIYFYPDVEGFLGGTV